MDKNIYNKYNDMDEIPLTDLDYQSVIYEPSKNIKNKKQSFKTNFKNKNSKTAKIKKAQNFNFKTFLTLTIFLGVFIFSIVSFLTYKIIKNYNYVPNKNINTNIATENNNYNEELSSLIKETNSNKDIFGIISEIDYNQKKIKLISINENKDYFLNLSNITDLKNEYGNIALIKEFKVGDLVNFCFNLSNNLIYLVKNKDAWQINSLKNVKVDKNKINLNDKNYYFSNNLIISKDNIIKDISLLKNTDIVTLKGYENIIYSIEIEKGTGNLSLKNKPLIDDATIEIGKDILKKLSDVDEIYLTEGIYKLIIRGKNINTFITEVNIKENETTVLDLSQLQNKTSTILINSNVSDYYLYINNELILEDTPLNLAYGAYKIKIEKNGYNTFETQIIVNNEITNLNINLEPLQQLIDLTINSTPENAEIYIDGSFIGYTPITYTTSVGSHQLILKKIGYNDTNLSNINVSETSNTFNITLHEKETTPINSTMTENQTN